MSANIVTTSRNGALATIAINRPQDNNVLDLAVAKALRHALETVALDSAVRVVVLRGEGRYFMVGGDIQWFDSLLRLPTDARCAQVNAIIDHAHAAIACIQGMDKPVIAAVRGAAAGYGLSLMAACDLAIAESNAIFTLAYMGLGTSPDGGSTFTLPRLIGLKRALAMALLNERIDAGRACEIGLINCAVEAAQFDQTLAAMTAQLLNGPQAAIARTKHLINSAATNSLQEHLLAEQQSFVESALTPDFAEGVRAFLAKRAPEFGATASTPPANGKD